MSIKRHSPSTSRRRIKANAGEYIDWLLDEMFPKYKLNYLILFKSMCLAFIYCLHCSRSECNIQRTVLSATSDYTVYVIVEL